jgi:hypothetical protein
MATTTRSHTESVRHGWRLLALAIDSGLSFMGISFPDVGWREADVRRTLTVYVDNVS